MKYPKGYRSRDGYIKVAVSFPIAVFDKIIKRATREEKTFNEMVAELCKVGELDLSESDRHEKAA